jgi:UTP--glucose-1-phosphate uridylyltransferase
MAGVKKFVFIIDDNPTTKALLEEQLLQGNLEKYLLDKGKKDELEQVRSLKLRPGEQISFVVQTEQTGLWDAVKLAKSEIVGDTFAVITPDDLILPATAGLPELAKHHQPGGITTSVEVVSQKDVSKFGIVECGSVSTDGALTVKGVIEKPALEDAPSDNMGRYMANAGRYILPVSLFDLYAPEKAATVKQEISVAHAINDVAGKLPVRAVLIPGTKYDGGSKVGLALANFNLYMDDPVLGPSILLALKLRGFKQAKHPLSSLWKSVVKASTVKAPLRKARQGLQVVRR